MEPGGRRRLQRLRQEAAEYYRGHRVPQRMEEALNALFPRRPADLYGELVARGGGAARRRPPRLLLRETPQRRGGLRGRSSLGEAERGRSGLSSASRGLLGPAWGARSGVEGEAAVGARRTGLSRSPLPATRRGRRAPCLPSGKGEGAPSPPRGVDKPTGWCEELDISVITIELKYLFPADSGKACGGLVSVSSGALALG